MSLLDIFPSPSSHSHTSYLSTCNIHTHHQKQTEYYEYLNANHITEIMASEKTSGPIAKLVERVKGPKTFSPEKIEQLTAAVQNEYGYLDNVLGFAPEIPTDADRIMYQELAQTPENLCKDCDHAHICHERHQKASFIRLHDPLQSQHYHKTCFRKKLPTPCWDCAICYEDNALTPEDTIEDEIKPKYGWVWRDSVTIGGTKGHLIYQVPDSPAPIRTRDGFAIPWTRFYCQEHKPTDIAGDMRCAKRTPIKDLIKETSTETAERAERCHQQFEKYALKERFVDNEDAGYYGFLLDTTDLNTEECFAVLSLFDVSHDSSSL